jgi:hypothetical protein
MRHACGTVLLALAVVGCDPPEAALPTDPPPAAAPHSSPRTTHAASLTGRVTWSGPAPQPATVTAFRFAADMTFTTLTRLAPNVPAVAADGGVGEAVVFLRGVDPAAAKPWDRPPVTIELHDERPMVRQGDAPPGRVGFVRRGDAVQTVSRQPLFHSARARGVAFWTLTLPDPDKPRTRHFDRPGVVELTSGANYYWMTGYLWVCEHPYFTATDAAGRWSLIGVPAGEYELVAWLPDWRTVRQERDPETGQIARYVFRPPLTATRRVDVRNGEAVTVGDVAITP